MLKCELISFQVIQFDLNACFISVLINFKNTGFSRKMNAGRWETRYFSVLSMRESDKKLIYDSVVLFMFQRRVIAKKQAYFSAGTRRKETYQPLRQRAREVNCWSTTPLSKLKWPVKNT